MAREPSFSLRFVSVTGSRTQKFADVSVPRMRGRGNYGEFKMAIEFEFFEF